MDQWTEGGTLVPVSSFPVPMRGWGVGGIREEAGVEAAAAAAEGRGV